MKTVVQTGARPERRGDASIGQFFRYHGWLAPGVRLFRVLGFPVKAACVSAAFVIPLAVLLWFVVGAANDQIETSQSERVGVAYIRPLLDLIRTSQARREAATMASADLPSLQAQVDKAFAAAQAKQAKQAELGAALKTDKSFSALRQQFEQLQRQPTLASADDSFEAHSAFIRQALELVREVGDSSQLALDPELDTYHLMNIAVLRQPMQLENTASLARWATWR